MVNRGNDPAAHDDLRWVPRDALAGLGIPAPVRTLVEAQFEQDQEKQP